jgi:hypothetical protein
MTHKRRLGEINRLRRKAEVHGLPKKYQGGTCRHSIFIAYTKNVDMTRFANFLVFT